MTAAGSQGQGAGLLRDLGGLPTDRAVQLHGADADEIASALARGTPELPVPVIHRIRPAGTPAEFVSQVLDDLESAAIGLFPGWLPGAEDIQPGGAGLVAVRAVAAAHASRSAHSSSFLADLAVTALSGKVTRRRRFPPEIRAVGLARVISEALGRHRLVLVLDLAAGLSTVAEQVVAAGGTWLADHARLGVWLTGEPLHTVDWLASATLASEPESPIRTGSPPATVFGSPHPRSAAEAALEAALAAQVWATGRRWNQSYQSHRLRNPVRLDLLWPDERCIVEIDGPEHCEPVRFDADRRRDVQLQLDGYAVLRFTNARVLHDVTAVVTQIGQFIATRRRVSREGTAWQVTN